MKVGIYSTYWPPHHGGGEKYAYNMVKALRERGVDAMGITPTPLKEGKDGGDESIVFRIGPETHIGDFQGMKSLFKNHIFPHIEEQGYDLLIMNNCRVPFHYFKDTVIYIKERLGIPCGVIHHDLGHRNRQRLDDAYKLLGDWEKAAEWVLEEQRKLLKNDSSFFHANDFYWLVDSPFHFDFDFVIGNSEWSNRFIDIENRHPRFVLHPILESPPEDPPLLERVSMTMLNPLYHKGRSYMSDLINDYTHDWTYRVLMGSYGDHHKKEFLQMIDDSWPKQQGRVDLVKYVPNVFSAYASTDVFVFPSRYEGYGMAAVEPMLIGTPVIAHDYPSIKEAVGEGAYLIKWGADSKEWYDAVEEVLYDPSEWIQSGLDRAAYLVRRQEEECDALVEFLKGVCA